LRCAVIAVLLGLQLCSAHTAAAGAGSRQLKIEGDYQRQQLRDGRQVHGYYMIEALQAFRLRLVGPLSLVLRVRGHKAGPTKLLVELDGRQGRELVVDASPTLSRELYLQIPAGTHQVEVTPLERLRLLPMVERKQRVAVLPPQLNTELEAGTGETLNEVLLSEFHQSGRLAVLGSSDIAAMLRHEEQRLVMAGCTDNACLAEIGGALGVQLIAETSIGAVGDRYVVTVKVLDVSQAKVLARASETIAGRQSALIESIRRTGGQAVEAICGPRESIVLGASRPDAQPAAVPVAAVRSASGPTAVETAPESVGWLDVAPWVALGLTVASGATAAALGGLAAEDAEAARGELAGTPPWSDLKDSAESKALGADVMIGVTAAAAAGTLVLFLLGDGGDTGGGADADSASAELGLAPTAGGGAASLKIAF
jgi:hypothetical protein